MCTTPLHLSNLKLLPLNKFASSGFYEGSEFPHFSPCFAVDAEKFSKLFAKWMQGVLRGGLSGKTIAVDGKTICSTGKLTKDGSALHIASAIVSEYGFVIGSQECRTKTGEATAFRELIDWLNGREHWENLSCIGAIHREFEKAGKKSSEWHYYISREALKNAFSTRSRKAASCKILEFF